MPLDDAELAALRSRLLELRGTLTAAVESTAEGARPVDLDQPIGRLSRMDALQQQNMVSANRRNHQLRLQRVIAALARIERGEYGVCHDCEEPIGLRRLRARPESARCISCQSTRESR